MPPHLQDTVPTDVVNDIFACALKKQTGVSLKYMLDFGANPFERQMILSAQVTDTRCCEETDHLHLLKRFFPRQRVHSQGTCQTPLLPSSLSSDRFSLDSRPPVSRPARSFSGKSSQSA